MWFKLTLIETEKMFYSISKWQFMNIHYSNILNSVPFRIMLAGAIQNPVYDSNLSKEVTTLRMRFFSMLDSWSIANKKWLSQQEKCQCGVLKTHSSFFCTIYLNQRMYFWAEQN